jgi:hypothetical protein
VTPAAAAARAPGPADRPRRRDSRHILRALTQQAPEVHHDVPHRLIAIGRILLQGFVDQHTKPGRQRIGQRRRRVMQDAMQQIDVRRA